MAAVLMLAMALTATAKQSADSETSGDITRSEALEAIMETYVPWENVEFSGKLHQSKLPLSPTVKIYMEKGRLIQMSARAPFVGEVGRLTLTQDSILIVYKLKKSYCLESTEKLRDTYPGFLDDIQSFLLARMVVAGRGELSQENAHMIELDTSDRTQWLVTPRELPAMMDVAYGYTALSNGRTQTLMMNMPSKEIEVDIVYDYDGGGMVLDLHLQTARRQLDAELDFSSVRWGGKAMDPIRLGGKYTRMGIKEFLKSF